MCRSCFACFQIHHWVAAVSDQGNTVSGQYSNEPGYVQIALFSRSKQLYYDRVCLACNNRDLQDLELMTGPCIPVKSVMATCEGGFSSKKEDIVSFLAAQIEVPGGKA